MSTKKRGPQSETYNKTEKDRHTYVKDRKDSQTGSGIIWKCLLGTPLISGITNCVRGKKLLNHVKMSSQSSC